LVVSVPRQSIGSNNKNMSTSSETWPSEVRVLYICGLGCNTQGTKPQYLHKHFVNVFVPSIKHASFAATKQALQTAVREFQPDVIVAHSAGVGKAVTLATSGAWHGPMILLAGGNGCAKVSDLVGQNVTVVVPQQDPDAKVQLQAVRSLADPARVAVLQVDDVHDLNASMVRDDRLRHVIVETWQRREEGGPQPPVAECADASHDVRARLRWLFSEWDLNSDGLVSHADFKRLFMHLDPDADVSALLQELDSNGDGTIDIDEFLNWALSNNNHNLMLNEPATGMPLVSASGPQQDSVAAETSAGGVDCQRRTEAEPRADLDLVPPEADPESFQQCLPLQHQQQPQQQPQIHDAQQMQQPPQDVTVPRDDDMSALAEIAARVEQLLPGQLFTWGRGSDGQLGQDEVKHPAPNCALPHPVRGLNRVIHVACGGGQQGSTAAVTSDGKLFTFGNNYKGRLGHGPGPAIHEPRLVEALVGECVVAAACGADHSAALLQDGRIFTWGDNRRGQLGRQTAEKGSDTMPVELASLPGAAAQVDCEDQYSAAVLADGRLFTWGSNNHGKLGVGSDQDCRTPTEVRLGVLAFSVCLGSMYAGVVGRSGELFMWGYGGHGNLGLGNRKSTAVPVHVPFDEAVIQVACTRGQDGCKGGLNPASGGQEGPHTVVVGASGSVYTMGTCHKGLLCNLGNKDGAFGKPWDELRPYRVGGTLRNRCDNPPLSPLALWPPPYDGMGPVSMAVSAHIHSACVGRDGRAWAWGCGSNDGRCGVERFLNMKGEGKPPEVDLMKCYMMGPHRIGVARPNYWKHRSLRGMRVLMLASGRNHMAAIAMPDEDV